MLAPFAQAQTPIHRYSFGHAGGAVPNGTAVLDSAGTAHGTVRGAGATGTSSGLRIAGGSPATAAYIDLPNGVASGKDQSPAGYAAATYEVWLTVNSHQNWSRIFDFGTSSLGEITASGGTFTGSNYFMLSANMGTDPNIKMERLPGGAQEVWRATIPGVRMHLVTTYDALEGAWKLYKNGILFRTLAANGPGTIPDVNVWLGRSNWSTDSNADATYEEFRIYGQALSPTQVWESFRTGPDALPTVTPTAYQILVDSSPAMTAGAGNYATEWNTAGNLEGWAVSQTTGSVAGGSLSGTTTGTNPTVSRSNFAGGPDLDLGWNDYLEVRMQVPASYTGAIQISYGTTYDNGFDASRVLTIPTSLIPKDGAFHSYRIEMGLVPLWRSTLRDLRIEPVDGAGSTGMAFAIDYLRVGDEPNAVVYNPINTWECPPGGAATPPHALHGAGQPVQAMESKHFRVLWNSAAPTDAHGTLRNLEEAWQVFARKLGYREPDFTGEDREGGGGTVRGKVNLTTWYEGYFQGGTWDGNGTRPWTNIEPSGLQVNPPTWVIPHELMHVFQAHNNSGGAPGEWYEGHANYARERWMEHYWFAGWTSFDAVGIRFAHMIQGDGRDAYLKWTPFLYLDSNPDNLPDLGEVTVASIWRQAPFGMNPFNALDTAAPITGKKNVFGHYAQHGATLNYPTRPMLRYWAAGDPYVNRFQFTDLQQRSDDPSWWRVPYEMAPQQGCYTVHELSVPNPGTGGRVVTVNFQGVSDNVRGADWRGGFTVTRDDGSERYTQVLGNGTHSVTLAANENRLFFCVAGTPNWFEPTGADEGIFPYRSSWGKSRFPYQMQVTGATPVEHGPGGVFSGMVQHANGGGWKHTSASVSASAYIGPNARVYDYAIIGANARVEDFATVQNNGRVLDNGIVSGHGWVKDNATVSGNGKVRDFGLLAGAATVTGNGRVLEHAEVIGNSWITDISVVKGSARCTGGLINGNSCVDGNYEFFRNIFNGFVTGHLPYEGIPDRFIMNRPGTIYASYDFGFGNEARIFDQYGVTDSFTIGAPGWLGNDVGRQGVLTLNGTTQHVNLDRSVADLRDFSFAAWVKPGSSTANQAVLWMGSSTTKRLYFTPNDGSGHAKFSIVNGGTEQTLTAASALPVGTWSHVAVTLDGATGVLYLNGRPVATGSITIRADQLLAPNTATGLSHNYLGRSQGAAMARFTGALDNVGFYSTALTPASIAAISGTSVPLAAPIGLAATPGPNQVSLSWNAADNATSYNVKRATISGGPYTVIANRTSHTYLDTTANAGTTYYYVVSAVNGASESANSIQVSVTPNPAPSLVHRYDFETAGSANDTVGSAHGTIRGTATVSAGALNLTGAAGTLSGGVPQNSVELPPAAVTGLSGPFSLEVWYTAANNGPFCTLFSFSDGTTASYALATPARNTIPYPSAVAVKGGGGGAGEQIAHQAPTDDNVLHSMVFTYDGTTMKYYIDGALSSFSGLQNSFANPGFDLSTLASIGIGGGSPWPDNTIKGKIHDFRVYGRALTAAQVSSIRNLGANGSNAAINAAVTGLLPPTGLATSRTDGQVSLTWNASSSAMSYNVKRAVATGGPYTTIASPTSTSHSDTTAENGTTYYYVVSAVNLGGQSINSTEVSATPLSPAQLWRQQKFGADWNNEAVAGDSADPDKDGAVNLLERAFAGNPNFADTDILPKMDPTAPLLSITFRKAKAATDLTFGIQESIVLSEWSTVADNSVVISEDSLVEIRRFTTSPGSEGKKFLRLRITGP
ncbi:MAG: LamG-like jellyroll fold domain-containing protein [Verrucomicrobiota bacterium]